MTKAGELSRLLAETKPEGDCLIWQGTRWGQYGRVRWHGRDMGAHRAVLQVVLGRELSGQELACHRCDNPPCVNPEHLFVGSVSDNARDMVAKGRNYSEKLPETRAKLSVSAKRATAEGRRRTPRGERVGTSKLTNAQVLAIRAAQESQRKIAARFGVSQRLVGMIRRREVWTHV